ncbi:peptidylprolyl isomerase [soil metagenome]
MNRILLAITIVSAGILIASCSSAQSSAGQSESENVIATFGDRSILKDDLVTYYERNNLDEGYTSEDLKEFLPYYVDFKLKLAYGEENGVHKDPEILNEFENYSKQAAFSYWLENDIKKQLLDEFIERSKYEVKSHHILIQLDERASSAREEEAISKLKEARERFVSGEKSMEELDSEYSTQMQGRSAGGELPWLSAGVTVKPFEDVLYSLEPGEISEPVRTQFGYHLIYLIEKRERIPDRKMSHIFFRGNRGELSAEELSQHAYEALESGQPWNEVVREYSQDGSSLETGGDIGWIGYGRQFSAEFIDAVMKIDTSLSYTEPIQTNYGYHIFQVDSVQTYTDEEHRKAELSRQMEDLPRYTANRQQVLQRLAQKGSYQEHSETIEQLENFFATADTTVVADMQPAETLASKTIVSFDGDEYNVSDFIEWITNSTPNRKADDFSNAWFEEYKEYLVDSRVIEMTRREFSDFDSEIEGFLNGLIVFQISDNNIWNPETADSTALKAFYEEHKDNYQYGQRYDYTLLASRSDSVLNAAVNRVKEGEDPTEFAEYMEDLVVSRDSVATPSDEFMEVLNGLEAGQMSEPFRYRNSDAYIILNQMLEPRHMTFDEAFHRVSSDYQPIREELFMSRLREQFNVQTYPDRI